MHAEVAKSQSLLAICENYELMVKLRHQAAAAPPATPVRSVRIYNSCCICLGQINLECHDDERRPEIN